MSYYHRFSCLIAASAVTFSACIAEEPAHSKGISTLADLEKAPPLMGWSSWSSLRIQGLTEDTIKKQAEVMATQLQASGYCYINLDSGWFHLYDDQGLPIPDAKRFPSGMDGLASYLHQRNLKLGVYLLPGLPAPVWKANGLITGTNIHMQDIADTTKVGSTVVAYENPDPSVIKPNDEASYRIDYTKPGAMEYIQSRVDQLAKWGVDYVKMDFVGPGGGRVKADNRADIQAWHVAIQKAGRPIWLELSNSLDFASVGIWKVNANGWRMGGDIEGYGSNHLTTWEKISGRFRAVPQWAPIAGPGHWNDLDSIEIGNGDHDGLTPDERQSAMTLWCISCSPLIIGADLTKLEAQDLPYLTNSEVIAVDQAGQIATPLDPKTPQQVWRVKDGDGSLTVALFNLGSAEAKVSVKWSDLGLVGAASVRDLWQHKNLGDLDSGYEATLAPHACQLLKVTPH